MPDVKRNYHMDMVRRGGKWSCTFCGCTDSDLNALMKTECPHVYPVCKHCGGCDESNECTPDCPGIMAILGREDVYVVGSIDAAKKGVS